MSVRVIVMAPQQRWASPFRAQWERISVSRMLR
jgi:hypothetical protein